MIDAGSRLLTESGERLVLTSGAYLAAEGAFVPVAEAAPRLVAETGEPIVNELADGGFLIQGATLSSGGPFASGAIFPDIVGRGASGGPGLRTIYQEQANGKSTRIARWQRPLHRYNAAPGLRKRTGSNSATSEFLRFYRRIGGSQIGFRFRDKEDWTTHSLHSQRPDVQNYQDRSVIGAGGDETPGVPFNEFQLVKRYRFGNFERVRPITLPIPVGDPYHDMHVFINGAEQVEGSDYTVNYDQGIVTFLSGREPARGSVVEWAGSFHVPCRFGIEIDPRAAIDVRSYEAFDISDVPIVEIGQGVEWGELRDRGGVGEIVINLNPGGLLVETPVQGRQVSLSEGRTMFVAFGGGVGSGANLWLSETSNLADGFDHLFIINTNSGSLSFRVLDENDNTIVSAVGPRQMASFFKTSLGWRAQLYT